MVRPLRHSNALTKYTVRYNEAVIIKKMAPMVDRVKDSYFLAYKELEHFPLPWFDDEDH